MIAALVSARQAPPSLGVAHGIAAPLGAPAAAADAGQAIMTGGAQQLALQAPAVTTRKFIKDAHASLSALGVNHLAALPEDARSAVQVG